MQCSQALRALPVVVCLAQPLAAQARYRVTADGEWFHQEPGGKRLARLARGSVLAAGEARGDWLGVTLEGWIFGTSVGATPRARFDLAVTRAPEENLRSAPAGALVAKLARGFLLSKVGEQGRWVHVQRSGWVKRASVEPVAQVASSRPAPAADTQPAGGGFAPGPRPGDSTRSPSPSVDPSRAQPGQRATLYRAPDGPAAGTLAPATPLRVLGRSGEWTRVQLEGWVKSADLQTAPPGVLVGVSAAELRADPQRYAGQVLQWTLQFIAVQKADELRPDIPDGATYILARGPLPERGFVYVVVPESKLPLLGSLTPLATIRVTARVRTGRSRFLGNPVVDLLSLEAQS